MNEKREPTKEKPEPKLKLIAKKAFVICQNDFFRTIAAGDDLSDLPAQYLPNMKTEGVLSPTDKGI